MKILNQKILSIMKSKIYNHKTSSNYKTNLIKNAYVLRDS